MEEKKLVKLDSVMSPTPPPPPLPSPRNWIDWIFWIIFQKLIPYFFVAQDRGIEWSSNSVHRCRPEREDQPWFEKKKFRAANHIINNNNNNNNNNDDDDDKKIFLEILIGPKKKRTMSVTLAVAVQFCASPFGYFQPISGRVSDSAPHRRWTPPPAGESPIAFCFFWGFFLFVFVCFFRKENKKKSIKKRKPQRMEPLSGPSRELRPANKKKQKKNAVIDIDDVMRERNRSSPFFLLLSSILIRTASSFCSLEKKGIEGLG